MKTTEIIANDEGYIIMNILDKSERRISKIKEYLKVLKNNLDKDIKGIIIISNSTIALARVDVLNKDGSNSTVSANAIMCTAKYLYENKYTRSMSFDIETSSGIKNILFECRDGVINNFDINLGKGDLNIRKIPMLFNGSVFINQPIEVSKDVFNFTGVSVGNPHIVSFVDDIRSIDIETLGPKLECYYLFPERINVEFAQILNENNIRVKLWERGYGVSKSCGTAAAAVVYAGIMSKNLKRLDEYTIHSIGEIQRVRLDNEENLHIVNPYYKVYKK